MKLTIGHLHDPVKVELILERAMLDQLRELAGPRYGPAFIRQAIQERIERSLAERETA